MNISKMSVERPLCSLHIAAATGLQFYDTFRYVCSLFGLLFHSKSFTYAGNRKDFPNTHAKTFAMFKIMNMTVPSPDNM